MNMMNRDIFNRRNFLAAAGAILVAPGCPPAFAAGALRLSPDLFAFDNGTGRDQKVPLDRQAEMLATNGYAGMALFTGTKRIPEALKALDARNLRLLGLYVQANLDDGQPRLQPGLPEAIQQLAGRETMIGLTVRGQGKDAEQRAVETIGEIADMAARVNLRVCLYPHVNLYMETAADGVRLIRKTGRKNISLVFNLYHNMAFHWLRCGGEVPDFAAELRRALPYIGIVAINGIDNRNGAPKIVRLDQGNYDVTAFMKTLNMLGYTGPVAIQFYSVPGDVAENLAVTIKTWKGLLKQLAE
jgi:sugar phosphate isomerase/epimerase